ncbi:cytosolic carboxypeptidase 3 isoform X10 [Mus caroli]|uniref:Cytosolic carboxypeptidase 3 isoform X10 n=1 Tax=Mus caroli TaxID=10089 RepID=A0A6P7RBB6_MUSCR|nr:cytosolic carboxypeptidase 3 isoform X10 [Mus caroli]
MSEDSEEEDYSDRSISDDDELDEDSFMKFVSDDIHPCTLLAADSVGDPFFPRTTQILLEYQLGRWVPRLRGPRDLYGVSSSGPLSPTRWPYHCEVIDEKVQHIVDIDGLRKTCVKWSFGAVSLCAFLYLFSTVLERAHRLVCSQRQCM